MANYHVTNPKGSDSWKVLREGAKRAATNAGTQKEAEKIAKQLSSNSGGGEVKIHKPKEALLGIVIQLHQLMIQIHQKIKNTNYVLGRNIHILG